MNLFKRIVLALPLLALPLLASASDADGWNVHAVPVAGAPYFGVTVANGMIGLVSAREPMQLAETVLNGAYDNYGRGRVDNILKGFNF
ncbi:MAG: hypothetical protein ACEQSK_06085, partial [Sphingomonadaceae bacterium]